MAVTKLISVDDFWKLVNKVESERDRIVILLLFGTGCRVEELISTKPEDVDAVKGEIHIHASRTKTRQYRDVIIPQSMPQQASQISTDGSRACLKGLCGCSQVVNISQRWIWMVIDKAARSVGIQRPYATRRAYERRRKNRDGDLKADINHRRKSYEGLGI